MAAKKKTASKPNNKPKQQISLARAARALGMTEEQIQSKLKELGSDAMKCSGSSGRT